jgi:hypothetical protein
MSRKTLRASRVDPSRAGITAIAVKVELISFGR